LEKWPFVPPRQSRSGRSLVQKKKKVINEQRIKSLPIGTMHDEKGSLESRISCEACCGAAFSEVWLETDLSVFPGKREKGKKKKYFAGRPRRKPTQALHEDKRGKPDTWEMNGADVAGKETTCASN